MVHNSPSAIITTTPRYLSLLFLLLLPGVTQSKCPYSSSGGYKLSSRPLPNDANHQRIRRRRRRAAAAAATSSSSQHRRRLRGDTTAISADDDDISASTTTTGRRRVEEFTCWTIDAYYELHDLIEQESSDIGDVGERGHFLGGIVRLAAHDFMDYDRRSVLEPGGSDGCLDLNHTANAGLSDIWCDDEIECPLKKIYDSHYSFSSVADFWVAAATSVIELTSSGELSLPFRFGRRDASSCGESSNRLPEATGCSEVEETFLNAMGLGWEDAVALIGAHTLGRGDVSFSGHDGTWVATDDESIIFDKKFYDDAIDRSWRPRSTPSGTDWTWGGKNRTVMMLNTDMCLYFDIPDGNDQDCCTNMTGNCKNIDKACTTAKILRPDAFNAFEVFYDGGSNDNTPFFEAFSVAWEKATSLGTTGLLDITHYDYDCVERTRRDSPNIIIMQPDDLPFFTAWSPPEGGAGSSFASSSTIPNIERLRTQGLQMMQAYTASPKCGTSRYSTITGRYPSRSARGRERSGSDPVATVTIPTTKLEDVGDEMDCSNDNLAKIFQRNEYRTGFFGKWHLHKSAVGSVDTYAQSAKDIEKCGFDIADGVYVHNLDNYEEATNHNLEWMTGLAIDFIKDDVTYGDKPFFMYFNPTVPHNSGDVLDALKNGDCTSTTSGTQPEPRIKGMNFDFEEDGCRAYREDVIKRAGTTDNKELGAVWLDDAVGALLTALEDRNILDDTIFLFQLDHGLVAKSELLEGGTRIPQFVHYPKEFDTSGMNFDGMVSTIDIGPTLLDYADITTLSPGYYDMDGVSWRDAVGDDPLELTWNSQRCLLFEYGTNRAVRCACEKYADVDGVEYYHNLCDASGNYLDYTSGIDPEATNRLTTDTKDRVELLEDVMACYLTKTEPSSTRDFTNDCAGTYQTMAPNQAPSTLPTMVQSFSPSLTVSEDPSISPTMKCTDVREFYIDGGATRDCKW
eukprot:CAMPEP_0172511598 /NCGR_PEP_ID=MMETSP1066-20121228/237604_1 /TAXON_ID=671091 /ORGANISM="Coscinodiscus wailesii, Strain CCMP2513" /LENGTH=963 /DNA_ID=CAMNT_0013291045 /DNA_START=206 /DNA_END=3094 /DNA_ORIENTATION=-